ncbi:putative glycosyltransferase family 2 protein [Botrytis fragariae]|uniref:Putative glycosyltransferase family 2 protein n=1 Tax=Botrytis fragariae TaxID=1964551 RepID=A0A8H6B0S5_9HELO|nr:putative glycosyltransferase family 2 protein [Botrytis fragariae]KAF5877030.1 putative glycosyltransferase family 2 protein [Botrytis fragariae]
MNALKGYLAPGKKAEQDAKKAKKTGTSAPMQLEMHTTPPLGSPMAGSFADRSRPSSLYPEGDFRNGPRESVLTVRSDVVVSWLHQQQMEKLWAVGAPGEGVILKKAKGDFTCCPPSLRTEPSGIFDYIVAMNVRAAMTVNTRVIKIFLARQHADYVPLSDGLRLQVLPTVEYLPRCQKHHFGAFIQDQQILIVWDDDPKHLLQRAEYIERSLLEMIWADDDEETDEKKGGANVSTAELGSGSDVEDGYGAQEKRPTLLLNPLMVGATLCLLVTALGLGWRKLGLEVAVDGNYTRLALLAVVPCQVFVSLFFMQVIIVNLTQCFGPINNLNSNSKFYSGKAPQRLNRNNRELPHVTIQMPVYKEGLVGVIQPTIISLKAAISTYELQGGTANIFINDDGMQLLPEDEAQARRDFYDEHTIGWVARPGHKPNPENGEKAFLRRGKFKKASNMNYALMVSNKVEERLLTIARHEGWSQAEEYVAYDQCLARVLEGEEGRAWAGGNIRVGDYILLIDSDTRVPADCLLDAASEMEQSPEVGILQFNSGVMQVTDSFFENGITFFTNLVYTAIRFAVAMGDVSPFVGHNAMLRWSAVQQVSYHDEDGYEKFWSESHVSEDFDMSLRLQVNEYIIRYAAYTGDGFKEGVSLTVYDELARWEKYAYGCNELLFNPLRFWITRGPFTKLFREFLRSNMRFTSKITMMAYIGTYYAIGASWILTLANYFIMGWYVGMYDKYYLDSFQVYFSLIIVFSLLGNVSLAVLRYRLNERGFFSSFFENLKWLLLMTVFLGGLSMHVSQSLLCHFFEIDMTWGATAKEVENVTFFEEIPRLLKRFKYTFLFCILMTAGMIVCALVVPWNWRIDTFVAIFPLCTVVVSHFLMPIALNPALMMFTW